MLGLLGTGSSARSLPHGNGPRGEVQDCWAACGDLEVLGLGGLCADAGRRQEGTRMSVLFSTRACRVPASFFEAVMPSNVKQRSKRFRPVGELQRGVPGLDRGPQNHFTRETDGVNRRKQTRLVPIHSVTQSPCFLACLRLLAGLHHWNMSTAIVALCPRLM